MRHRDATKAGTASMPALGQKENTVKTVRCAHPLKKFFLGDVAGGIEVDLAENVGDRPLSRRQHVSTATTNTGSARSSARLETFPRHLDCLRQTSRERTVAFRPPRCLNTTGCAPRSG